MYITVYNNTSDNRTLEKILNNIGSYTARPVEPFSRESPSFIVTYDTSILSAGNYLFCSDLNRYYYINDIVILTGGRIQINCGECDVLMTYKESINSLTALCIRNETLNNQRIIDKNFPTTGDTNIKTLRFDSTALTTPDGDKECYVLIVSGSKGA